MTIRTRARYGNHHNGLSLRELGKLLRRVEKNVVHERAVAGTQ